MPSGQRNLLFPNLTELHWIRRKMRRFISQKKSETSYSVCGIEYDTIFVTYLS
jgi:hypothetical protein